jgi:hypothetical protein
MLELDVKYKFRNVFFQVVRDVKGIGRAVRGTILGLLQVRVVHFE